MIRRMIIAPPPAPPAAPPANPAASDAQLLAATARGDGPALGELVRRYVDFVYAAARRLIDRHAAEDVTQAVFLVLARKAGAVRAEALPAWLHRTTQYAAANANRADRRRLRHERAAARKEATRPYVLPEADPLWPLLDEAIDSLGHRDRVAVIERYLLGRDYAALGAAIGLSPASAQKRVERAVGKLRKFFGRAGVPTGGMAVTAALAAAVPSSANAAPPAVSIAIAHAAPAGVVAIASQGAFTMTAGMNLKIVAGLALAAVLGGGGYATVQYVVGPPPATPSGHVVPTAGPAGPAVVPAAAGSPNEVTLRNGVTIRLLAVGEKSPDGSKTWWKPDGSPAPTPAEQGMGSVGTPAADQIAREFAYQESAPDDAAVEFSVVGASGRGGGGSAGLGPTQGYAMVAAVPPRPATLRFDVAAGPWSLVDEVGVRSAAAGKDIAGGVPGLTMSPPVDIDGAHPPRAQVKFDLPEPTGRPKTQWRAVGLDAAGRRYPSSAYSSTAANGRLGLTLGMPDVKAADLVRVRLESRPYDDWVEFRDVSVRAGEKTSPTVATSDDGAPVVVRLGDGTRVELVAVGDFATDQWWTPEGTPAVRPLSRGHGPTDAQIDRARRGIWLVFTADRAGKPVNGTLTVAPNGLPSRYAFTADEGGRTYHGQLVEVDPARQTVDWRTHVASRPTVEVRLDRPVGGWTGGESVDRDVPRFGRVAVWGVRGEPYEGGIGTGVDYYVGPKTAPGQSVNCSLRDAAGNEVRGTSSWVPNGPGANQHQTWSATPDTVAAAVLQLQDHDQTAWVRNVTLHPGVPTKVRTAAAARAD